MYMFLPILHVQFVYYISLFSFGTIFLDRIIEIAGGREIYSQSRTKALRKSRGSLADDGGKKSPKSPIKQGVWELRSRNETKKKRNSRDYTETVFSSEVCSITHEKNEDNCLEKSSPVNMTFPGEVVVFDDIDDNRQIEKNNRIENEHSNHTASKIFATSDNDSEKVTKVIGNLPIAVYEGSPRRYGQKHMDNNCSRPQLPSAQSLLASPSVYPPRPGFPHRIISTPSPIENESGVNIENNIFSVSINDS